MPRGVGAAARARTHHENSYKEGERFDVRVFTSSSLRFSGFSDTAALLWHEEGLEYTATFATRERRSTCR